MAELKAAPPAIAAVKYSADAGMTPATFDEAWRMSQLFAASDLVPKDYKGKPENCLVAMQLGAEIGLKPMQALQGIAVINGRPSIWGDAMWALVLSSPLVEDAHETFDPIKQIATCTIKRRGRSEPIVQTFSQEDARLAGLWGKQGPWTTNPRRMLQMRARGFCSRDAVPDVLKGVSMIEESNDIWVEQEREPVRPGTAALEAKARAAAAKEEPAEVKAEPTEEALKEAVSAGARHQSALLDHVVSIDEAENAEEVKALAESVPEEFAKDVRYQRAVEQKLAALAKPTPKEKP